MQIRSKKRRIRPAQPPFFCLENGKPGLPNERPGGRLDREMAPVKEDYSIDGGEMQGENRVKTWKQPRATSPGLFCLREIKDPSR